MLKHLGWVNFNYIGYATLSAIGMVSPYGEEALLLDTAGISNSVACAERMCSVKSVEEKNSIEAWLTH